MNRQQACMLKIAMHAADSTNAGAVTQMLVQQEALAALQTGLRYDQSCLLSLEAVNSPFPRPPHPMLPAKARWKGGRVWCQTLNSVNLQPATQSSQPSHAVVSRSHSYQVVLFACRSADQELVLVVLHLVSMVVKVQPMCRSAMSAMLTDDVRVLTR